MNIMVIVAHIDDCEVLAGGLVAKLTARGDQVTIAAMTDGEMGHHLMSKEETRNKRRAEGLAAAEILGANYEFMHITECEIMPTVENRKALVAMIRRHDPDILITHPPCDYHADHKYTAELVADAAYMLQVPKFAPSVPAMRKMPYIFYSVNRPVYMDYLTPAWIMPIDNVMKQKLDALHCHTCQMYEWLPWVSDESDRVPAGEPKRRKFLSEKYCPPHRNIANRYRDLLIQEYGETGERTEFAEALFKSPLGRGLTANTCRELFGSLSL